MTTTLQHSTTWPAAGSMSAEGNDFLEYLDMFDEPELLTKSELLEEVRDRGLRISERQLVTYVTEGIVPKSVRVGSRAGVFPRAVADLLEWVVRTRDRGVTVEGVKELVPLWKYSMRAMRRREFDLREFERLARTRLTLPDAMFAVPGVIAATMPCANCLDGARFVLKDGTVVEHSSTHPVSMHFQIADIDHDDPKRLYRWDVARMTLPIKAMSDESNLIVMGVPVDFVVPPEQVADGCADSPSPAERS